jgi:hypothetical protein
MPNVILWIYPVCRACYGYIPWGCVICTSKVEGKGGGAKKGAAGAEEVEQVTPGKGGVPHQDQPGRGS